jgi:hypothetical protein
MIRERIKVADPQMNLVQEKRRPSSETVERVYKIGLDELARTLGISEPATLIRTVEVNGGELIFHYKGTLKS